MIVVKVKMVNNQQKEVEIDYNSDINTLQFKHMVSFKYQTVYVTHKRYCYKFNIYRSNNMLE